MSAGCRYIRTLYATFQHSSQDQKKQQILAERIRNSNIYLVIKLNPTPVEPTRLEMHRRPVGPSDSIVHVVIFVCVLLVFISVGVIAEYGAASPMEEAPSPDVIGLSTSQANVLPHGSAAEEHTATVCRCETGKFGSDKL